MTLYENKISRMFRSSKIKDLFSEAKSQKTPVNLLGGRTRNKFSANID